MSNADWYPAKLTDRIPWHANFNIQVTATGSTFSLVAGDKTDVANDAANVALVINFKQAVADYAQAVTEWAELILDGPEIMTIPAAPTSPTAPTFAAGSKTGIQPRTRTIGAVIKADPDFTQAYAELYGLVAPAAGPLADPFIRSLTPVAGTSNVTINLGKGGYSLIAIDMRRSGGSWSQIGVSQTAEFIDTTPPATAGQPEGRDYRVQGMQNNARVGGLSPTVSTVTIP